MRITTTQYVGEHLFQSDTQEAVDNFKAIYSLDDFLTTVDYYPNEGNRLVYSIKYKGQDISTKGSWDLVIVNTAWIYGDNEMTPYMQRIIKADTYVITKTEWDSLPAHYKASLHTAARGVIDIELEKLGIKCKNTVHP